MFEDPIVSFDSGDGFNITGVDIVVDEDDYSGLHIAVDNLRNDFARVTGQDGSTKISHPSTAKSSTNCILIGSLIKSGTIKTLVDTGKIDVSDVAGKWETWKTFSIKDPGFGGYENALVIVGSDKRAAIFGTYSLSEQIGVSPWYWWADVPDKKHSEIYALPTTTINGEPSVKYRGIFINDEAPGMDSWVHEKFGPKFGVEVYKHVYELLLRLKANFMWPGMWRGYPFPGRSFFVDDPDNQKTADEYGIVVGTSHHEPMQRAMNEWSVNEPEGTWDWEKNREKIIEYFDYGAKRAVPYESYITMGMRGEGDYPVSGDDPVATLTDIIQVQRDIIKKHYGSEDGELQLMALYKEVQEYYSDGLQVPEDVTILFADDNHANQRRLPTPEEAARKGGVGFYYHFQYTGQPRSYRWMNSNVLGKAWHQLQLGYDRGADRIWIFNVGDIKPQELPMSFAFDLAWNVKSIAADGFLDYFRAVATRDIGSEHAEQVAQTWYGFERLQALRKHEHIEPEDFSILKYNEAQTIIARWKELVDGMEAIHSELTDEKQRASFFQLALHPVKASYIYNMVRYCQTRNRLYGKQRRNSTNALMQEVIDWFNADYKLETEYHSLLDGRWNHMLRQPHYGYTGSSLGPYRNLIDGLSWVMTQEAPNPIMGHMGVVAEGTEGHNPGTVAEDSDRTHPSRGSQKKTVTLQPMSNYGPQTRWFEIFHRGTVAFDWEATPQHEWVSISETSGTLKPIDPDVKIYVDIDWAAVPDGFDEEVYIEIVGSVDGYEKVWIPVQKRQAPEGFSGFVEVDTYVSIHAGKWATAPYIQLPVLGRLEGGSVTLPNDTDFSDPDSLPFLRYDMHTFTDRNTTALELHFVTTIDIDPVTKMHYDIRWDNGEVQTFRLTEESDQGYEPIGWSQASMDYVWKRRHDIGAVAAGNHVLEVRLRYQNMALEKLVVDLGGTEMKYLGPPESDYVGNEKRNAKVLNDGEPAEEEMIRGSDSLNISLRI